jgi:hypothetical protein
VFVDPDPDRSDPDPDHKKWAYRATDPDPADPDLYQFLTHVYFYLFHENFNMLSKRLKIMTHLLLMRKEKPYEVALL